MSAEPTKKRKRATKASSSDGDEEGRSRGRPRVDKQDESAADRRRTQIRMAQRAYRQRKESTLEDLRKRVSELTNTAELMNKTFVELRDRLSTQADVNDQRALWDVASRYEELMKIVRNPSEDDCDEILARPPALFNSAVVTETALASKIDLMSTNVPSWLDQSVLKKLNDTIPTTHLGLGYTMSFGKDESLIPALTPPSNLAYEAFVSCPPVPTSIPRELPPITTYSFQETTLGRRLHRAGLEAGYYMLLGKSKSDRDVEKVFRLSLMGRDRDKLMASIKAILARGINESLDSPSVPLIHVGGAGTHYPRRDHLGNVQPPKKSYNLGVVGPTTLALLDAAAKNNLETDMTVEIEGYEGQWLDPYDVEGYLREKGIEIDPSASFAEAVITDDTSSPHRNSTRASTSPLNDQTNDLSAVMELGQAAGTLPSTRGADADTWDILANTSFTGVGYSDAITGDWMNFLEPGQGINWLSNPKSDLQLASGTGQATNIFTSMNGVTGTSFNVPTPPDSYGPLAKRSVIIDVTKFVKVLVLGAGELGIAVLQSLVAHPSSHAARVAVLKRSAGSIEGVELREIEVVKGDVNDLSEAELAGILGRYHTVISCNGMTLPPETQTKLARAAIAGGVARYFPWQFGLDYDKIGRESSQDLFDAQLDVRDILRAQSSMQWVIVSTGIFTSFLFEPAFGVVNAREHTVTALGSWNNELTVTSPKDIGLVVAEVVLAAPEVDGIIYTAGDTISMGRLADVVENVLGTRVRRKLATAKELEAELKADPSDGMKKYRAVFAACVGVSWDKATSFNGQRNIVVETAEEWAQAHLSQMT
ncbi:hypothetical protein LTS14_006017 [Recurvomyces mirabilis]|nr:hypothetical protein LTS14_006017 [Recurvomyces mirabilis]